MKSRRTSPKWWCDVGQGNREGLIFFQLNTLKLEIIAGIDTHEYKEMIFHWHYFCGWSILQNFLSIRFQGYTCFRRSFVIILMIEYVTMTNKLSSAIFCFVFKYQNTLNVWVRIFNIQLIFLNEFPNIFPTVLIS